MEKSRVVDVLCANLQIEAIGEQVERAVITRAVSAVYSHVPPFVWDIVCSAADGIDSKDVDAVIEGISRSITTHAKMPWIPEMIRKQVIDQVLTTIRQALKVDAYIEALAK
jgi:hypothetical protein